MKKATRFVGLDVHAETIAVAVAESSREGEVWSNRPAAIRKLVQELGGAKAICVCYEAGPTGYVLYWQLAGLGVSCDVVAPTLIPQKAGDRVKTDRRDAIKLARCFRAGELTKVWVPDENLEALRDLVRAREAAKKDQLRARHRMKKFLLRAGQRPAEKQTTWSTKYMEWLHAVHFEHPARQATMNDYLAEIEHMTARVLRLEASIDEAVKTAPETLRAVIDGLQALRGVAKITAITVAVEVGNFSRFEKASQLMGWAGVTPSEYSTGRSRRQGAITKSGNSHVRRVIVEAGWSYRHTPRVGKALRARQRDLPQHIVEIGTKARIRLCSRYRRLLSKNKTHTKIAVAIGRELLGFAWAIATDIERRQLPTKSSSKREA